MADIRAQLNRVRDAANDAAATASDRIKDTRDNAGDLIQTGREKASGAYEDARDRSQRVAARANEIVQEHPVLAVAGAVAAGAVIAWMFPKSRRVVKTLPALATTVGTRIAEAAIAARAAASDGAQTVKHNASEALHVTSSAASKVQSQIQDRVSSADISAKASKLADEVTALVSHKLDAITDAVKARLPKN